MSCCRKGNYLSDFHIAAASFTGQDSRKLCGCRRQSGITGACSVKNAALQRREWIRKGRNGYI